MKHSSECVCSGVHNVAHAPSSRYRCSGRQCSTDTISYAQRALPQLVHASIVCYSRVGFHALPCAFRALPTVLAVVLHVSAAVRWRRIASRFRLARSPTVTFSCFDPAARPLARSRSRESRRRASTKERRQNQGGTRDLALVAWAPSPASPPPVQACGGHLLGPIAAGAIERAISHHKQDPHPSLVRLPRQPPAQQPAAAPAPSPARFARSLVGAWVLPGAWLHLPRPSSIHCCFAPCFHSCSCCQQTKKNNTPHPNQNGRRLLRFHQGHHPRGPPAAQVPRRHLAPHQRQGLRRHKVPRRGESSR